MRETQLSEELWTKIGQHLTLNEWAKAAGTCSAAWGAPCMWSMDIMTDLSVAGTFIAITEPTRRCTACYNGSAFAQEIARGSRRPFSLRRSCIAVQPMVISPQILE